MSRAWIIYLHERCEKWLHSSFFLLAIDLWVRQKKARRKAFFNQKVVFEYLCHFFQSMSP